MRIARKKQIKEFISLLEEAHEEIKQFIASKNSPAAMNLLEQCQEGALQLGRLIEDSEGEEFITIGILEEYCDLIYRIYEQIQKGRTEDVNKACKHLRKFLIRIENSVEHDIEVRTMAVFLPYKASMWDSLESVWRAADEDPHCDAYIIPIPYYDKRLDGSFGEKHYEGDLYPDHVPVTHYDSFDFAQQMPDMVFIHNPYDNLNSVTSVPPFFFSQNLKKYTEKLIYIPYFVLDEISQNNEVAVKKMEHFCTVPGVVNADKVIVQSEEMRQVYIKVLTRCAGEHTRGHWEKKISGMGSPKVDKIITTKKEELEIPKEWLRIIIKPDKSWKKIILYNTSIGALLRHREQMLEKMEDVFQVFKKNQNSTALLWRPHPLIEATLKSMTPQLSEKYEQIVESYRKEGLGIYDDTSDLNRAIALSDSYYGDGSSVVQLYQKTGKYIMGQRCDQRQVNKEYITLAIGAGVLYSGKVFFSELRINGLFSLDLNTKEIQFLKTFNEEAEHYMMFRDAYVYGNEAWFLPWRSEHIVKVNLDSLEMEYFSIPYHSINEQAKDELNIAYYTTGLIQDRYIYMIPTVYDTVLVIDMKEGKLYPYFDVVNTAQETFAYGCVVKEELWMCPYAGSRMIKLNLSTGEKEYFDWKYPKGTFAGMEYIDGEFWFSPDKGDCIMKVDAQMQSTGEVVLSRERKDGIRFSGFYYGNRYWILPSKDQWLRSIQCDTDIMEEWGEEDGMALDLRLGMRKISSQGKLLITSLGYLNVWMPDAHRFLNFHLKISTGELRDQFELNFFTDGNGVIQEEFVKLEGYIKDSGSFTESGDQADHIGRKIWNGLENG